MAPNGPLPMAWWPSPLESVRAPASSERKSGRAPGQSARRQGVFLDPWPCLVDSRALGNRSPGPSFFLLRVRDASKVATRPPRPWTSPRVCLCSFIRHVASLIPISCLVFGFNAYSHSDPEVRRKPRAHVFPRLGFFAPHLIHRQDLSSRGPISSPRACPYDVVKAYLRTHWDL